MGTGQSRKLVQVIRPKRQRFNVVECGDGTGLFGLSLQEYSQLFLKVNEKAAAIDLAILQTFAS